MSTGSLALFGLVPGACSATEACANSEPSVHVEEQATQDAPSEGIVSTTRSGRVVKSTKDCDNFVYY